MRPTFDPRGRRPGSGRAAAWKLLALAALLGVPPGFADAACPPLERAADLALVRQLDAVVDAALAEGFAGGVALLRDGVLVYERVAGFSDARREVPVTETTLFHVASIAKYVTAAVTLAAAEEGKLALADSIGSLAPGTPLAERGITVLDLLAHRSGLGSSYVAEGKRSAAEALAAIVAAPVDAERVGSFRYSNDGYDLLAILLERAYGRSYEEVARGKLFTPACLERPRFWSEVDLTDPTRVGQPLRKLSSALRQRNYGMLGSAGLLVTALDLARFQQALASGRLLAKGSLDELWAPRGETSIGQAALGCFLVDHPQLGRVISALGYEDWGDNAILNHYRDRGVILAVVTSKGPAEKRGERPDPFRGRIARAVEETLASLPAEAGGDP